MLVKESVINYKCCSATRVAEQHLLVGRWGKRYMEEERFFFLRNVMHQGVWQGTFRRGGKSRSGFPGC